MKTEILILVLFLSGCIDADLEDYCGNAEPVGNITDFEMTKTWGLFYDSISCTVDVDRNGKRKRFFMSGSLCNKLKIGRELRQVEEHNFLVSCDQNTYYPCKPTYSTKDINSWVVGEFEEDCENNET